MEAAVKTSLDQLNYKVDRLRASTSSSVVTLPIAEADVTGLIADLAAKVPTSRSISTSAPLTGGGNLSADRTFAITASNLLGTSNQVILSASGTGVLLGGSSITLSLPQDIHTGASPTFAGLTLSSMTAGSVIFAGASGLLSQDNTNFFWDNPNNRLGIGTSAPSRSLHVIDSTNPQLRLGADATYYFEVQVTSASGECYITPNPGAGLTTINVYTGYADVTGYVATNIINNDDTSPTSHAELYVSSGGASGGDAFATFTNAEVVAWTIGLDNDDADKFKVSCADFLGSSDCLTIDTAGTVATTGKLTIGGDLDHDGSKIGFFGTAPTARASAYTTTNVTTDRAYNADATTVDEIADVLGTLIADLKTYGLLQ